MSGITHDKAMEIKMKKVEWKDVDWKVKVLMVAQAVLTILAVLGVFDPLFGALK